MLPAQDNCRQCVTDFMAVALLRGELVLSSAQQHEVCHLLSTTEGLLGTTLLFTALEVSMGSSDYCSGLLHLS